jgi:hypothetical protein
LQRLGVVFQDGAASAERPEHGEFEGTAHRNWLLPRRP